MVDLSRDISNSIFRRTVAAPGGKVSMSGKMFDLLLVLDGHINIKEVSHKLGISVSDVRSDLSKLMEYGVVEEVEEANTMIDKQFFGYLAGQLSRIAGPMAQVMVEDAVLEIGGGSYELPKNRAEILIELLGSQIPDKKQRGEFIKVCSSNYEKYNYDAND